MRLRSLAYFREVARCCSFTQASRNLFISQQGLSKAITELERKLEVKLFVRDTRKLTLTKEGELLLDFAEDVAKIQGDFERKLDKAKSEKSSESSFGSLPLVAMPYVCSTFLQVIEKRAGRAVFDDLIIHENSLTGIIEKIKNGEIEFALVNVLDSSLPDLLKDDLAFVQVARAEILLLASTPLVSNLVAPVPPEALETMALAYYNEPVLNQFVERLGVKHRRIQHTSSVERITSAVASGKAASFTDTLFVYAHGKIDGVSTLPLETESGFSIGFLMSTEPAVDAEANEFVDLFIAAFNRCCGDYASCFPARS